MRQPVIAILALAAVAACGPEEPRAGSVGEAMEEAANPGALWPVMLAHCLRAPDCDPTSDFGQGAGQASGAVGQVSYLVESSGPVKDGSPAPGAAITLSLHAMRAQGGEAGRPLTVNETASDLRAATARRSTLSIEYRVPDGAAPQPYALGFRSAQVALAAPTGVFKTRNEMRRAAQAHVDAMRWPDGGRGAKVEITGTSGVVFAGYSAGQPADDFLDSQAALRRGFEPWVFRLSRDIRNEPVPALVAAIEAGETLGLKITAPDGGVMLRDAIYTAGYSEALREAREALADPELVRTIPERCARFASERDEFWKIADVTAALRVCDPRTADQRRRDEEEARVREGVMPEEAAIAPASPAPAR